MGIRAIVPEFSTRQKFTSIVMPDPQAEGGVLPGPGRISIYPKHRPADWPALEAHGGAPLRHSKQTSEHLNDTFRKLGKRRPQLMRYVSLDGVLKV
jgi:hypothetical protein